MKATDLIIMKEIINTSNNWLPDQRKSVLTRIDQILETDQQIKVNIEGQNENIKSLGMEILIISGESANLPLDFSAGIMNQLKPVEPDPVKDKPLKLLIKKEEIPDNQGKEWIISNIMSYQNIPPDSKDYKKLYDELIVKSHSELKTMLEITAKGQKEEKNLDSKIAGDKFKSKKFRGSKFKDNLIQEYSKLLKELPENLQKTYSRSDGEILSLNIPQIQDLIAEMTVKLNKLTKMK
jgi:hypothetical protein